MNAGELKKLLEKVPDDVAVNCQVKLYGQSYEAPLRVVRFYDEHDRFFDPADGPQLWLFAHGEDD